MPHGRGGRGGRGRTHYDVLELSRDATPTDVKKAYRRLAVRHHPDRNIGDQAGATVWFREVTRRTRFCRTPRRGGSTTDPSTAAAGEAAAGGRGRHSRARDPFDQFDDVFRNDPFFAEAFRSMDNQFASRFDAGGWQQQ